MRAWLRIAGLLTLTCCNAPERELVEIPAPVLSRLSPAVQEDLRQARASVEGYLEREDVDPAVTADAFGDLGRLYHAYDLADPALAAYRNAQTLAPSDFRWPYYRGVIERDRGDLTEAEAAFERAVHLAPRDRPARLALAQVLRERRAVEEAERIAREVLDEAPEDGGALLLLGEIASETGRDREAVGHYERLLEIQPGATRIFRSLALSYRNLGEVERARELLERVGDGAVRIEDPLLGELRARGAGAKKFMNRGLEEFRRGNYHAASVQFRQAAEADPQLVSAVLNLGSALAMSGKLDEAAEEYEKVLELEPDHAMTHFNLGTIAEKQGRIEKGRSHYRRALEIDPDYRDPRFNLANSLRRAGECAAAVPHFARVRELDPGNGLARIAEAACLAEAGRASEGKERLTEVLESLPEDRAVRLLSARLLAAAPQDGLRDGTRALAIAEAVDAERRSPETLEALGMALAELGRFDDAIAHMEQAIVAAKEAGRSVGIERMEGRLAEFRAGRPSRDPAL